MGILIPPSIKAIIRITTALVGLFSCHSPILQCCIDTLLGIIISLKLLFVFKSINQIKKSTYVGKIKDKRGEKSMNVKEEGRIYFKKNI